MVGHQIVNSHNSGSVNTDARVNRSRAEKNEFKGCTFNYGCTSHPCRIDNLKEEDILEVLVTQNDDISVAPSLIEVGKNVGVNSLIKENPEKMSSWKKWVKRIGIAGCILVAGKVAYNWYKKRG